MGRLVAGKNINLRDVEVEDAEFILSLRLNEKLNKYLSKTENDLARQIAWIRDYKTRENEYYFIIESKTGESYGTVRIYDIIGDSFSWGSWIITETSPAFAGIESALLVYEYAFDELGYNRSHFEVVKGNEKVIAFHERFGAVRVREDEEKYYFEITKDQYKITREKYKRFLIS